MKMLLGSACSLLLLAGLVYAQETIKLTLREPSGVTRTAWPVTAGVPFPKGLVRTIDQLQLTDDNGAPVAAQWRELGRWLKDGSIKAAACSFVADLGPSEAKGFHVVIGGERPSPALAGGVSLRDTGNGLLITNGVFELEVQKSPFVLIKRLSYDSDGNGRLSEAEVILKEMVTTIQNAGGRTFSAAESEPELEIVEGGPVRVVIRAKGKFTDGDSTFFSYDLSLSVYAGSPIIRLSHRIINTEGRPVKGYTFPPVPMQQLEVTWSLGDRVSRVAYPGVERAQVHHTSAPFRIGQIGDDQLAIGQGNSERRLSGRFPGWLDITAGHAAVTVAVENFWQLHPKAVGLADDTTLRLELIPGSYGDFAQGMAATHNISLLLHSATDEAAAAAFAAACQKPMMWTNPEWFSSSGVFGGPFGTTDVYGYDRMVDHLLEVPLKRREREPSYGLKNFGGWIYSPDYGYGQNQYGVVLSLLLHYMRTGKYIYYQTAREIFYHLADVDSVHYASHPWDKLMLGGKHSYAKDHTTSGMSGANAEGAWDCIFYYYLTGEPYAYETAVGQADAMLTFLLQPMNIGRITPSERDSGIPLFQLCELYKATGDKRYLEGARKIVDYRLGVPVEGIDQQQRTKGTQDPVHGCWHYSYGKGSCTWLTASSLLPGLAKYYEITGEERAKNAATKAAYWILKEGWDPEFRKLRRKILYQGVGGPVDASYDIYNRHYGGIVDLLSLPAFEYGYKLTGDEKFLEVGRTMLRQGIQDSHASRFKEFGQASKWSPYFMYLLQQRRR